MSFQKATETQSPAAAPGDRKYSSSDAMAHIIRKKNAASVHNVTQRFAAE
jgi:hypothetical protein